MRQRNYLAAAALIVTFVTVTPHLNAQERSRTATDNKEPAAIDTLKRMGTYLRSLKSFRVEANLTTQDVLDDGQRIDYSNIVDIVAAHNRFRIHSRSDRQERMFFYDGKSFTLWAQRLNYYATVPAPPTTGELINRLESNYGMEVPLVDLFRWGLDNSDITDIKTALNIGPSEIQGVTCQHYAFRQEGLDWQIWIQNGEFPLPRKLTLTTLTDEARPQFSVVYDWNLAPSFNEAAFTFVPPADAHRIVIAEVGAKTGGK